MSRLSLSSIKAWVAGLGNGRWGLGLVVLLALALAWDLGPGLVEALRRALLPARQDGWQQVQAVGKVRFGVDSNDWPLAVMDGAGQMVGLNPDLGRALGRGLGVQVEFVPVGYDGAYDALYLGQCDVLIGVLENDPLHVADFVYTGTYFDAGQVAVDRCGTPGDLRGRRLAVELGSQSDTAARWLARRTAGVTLLTYDSPQQALEAVAAGSADVAVADAVWARQAISGRAGLCLWPKTLEPYPLALAVRADSPRLRTALSRALAELESDGRLAILIATWLDSTP